MDLQSENQFLNLPILKEKGITLAIKREDLLHPQISGNKFRKLKYNIIEAKRQGHNGLLTFGGAYSNHIAATAAAAEKYGFKVLGIIRGEELAENWKSNPTLTLAYEKGMQFKFVSREDYRKRDDLDFLASLKEELGEFYLIPEGGTNNLAIKGCEEILTEIDQNFDIIGVCVGTGGTIAGIINSLDNKQEVLGFPVLKGDFMQGQIKKLTKNINWRLQMDYHFGGYGKVTEELILFINTFKRETGIPLDPVYTGKMVFGLLDMVKNDNFVPGTRILAIHTGGLQGIHGMNTVLQKKNLPLLDI